MALGTILATAAIGAAASAGANKLFGGGGGGSSSKNSFAGINAGGLNAKLGKKNQINLSSNPLRDRLVGDVASTFSKQAEIIGNQRNRARLGLSDLRASRLAGLENARQKSVGNLRDNIASRRVSGSSFGQNALTRANLAFQEEGDRIRSESFMQELDLTNKLIEQEFNTRRQGFQTVLDEMNLQAEVATQLATRATAEFGANARLKQELAAKSAAGAGEFFGQEILPGIKRGLSGFFGGGPNFAPGPGITATGAYG